METGADILTLRPFEVASIRPPTENSSLALRLTRNCYWNRCAFCPVYKLGASFSRRGLEEVLYDIHRAQALDDFMYERGIGYPACTSADEGRVAGLAELIAARQREAGCLPGEPEDEITLPENADPRIAWFLSWFNSRPDIAGCMRHLLAWRMGGGTTCFLGDADSLILEPDFLSAAIAAVRMAFPTVNRFTVYGRTSTAARRRSLRELKAYARAGLNRVHFGLESGCDRVLSLVNKGVTAEEHVTGCSRVKDAGLSCSVYVMPGLGGADLSEQHARDTAAVINRIAPDYVRLRSLEIFAGTGLEELAQAGNFREASEEQVVREIRTLVEEIDAETELLSDSASNLLNICGRIPDERVAMLAEMDRFLSLDPREKLEFSLRSRLESFAGQYGGLTPDLYRALEPCIRSGRLETSDLPDEDIERITRLVRMKLMP